MGKEIKLIAFDLDGTLLTTSKEITSYTRKILEEAAARGIEIVPATGRPIRGVPEDLYCFPGVRYAVTSNGARLIEMATGRTVREDLLSYEKAKEVLAILQEYDTMREVFYDGQGYIEKEKLSRVERYIHTKAVTDYITRTRVPVEDLEGMFERERRAVDKLQGLFADWGEREACYARLQKMSGIEVAGALGNNVEVNGAGVHKGAALAVLGERLGISPEEMLAFGDGSNDITMLQMAGTGIAVANAQPEVREAADGIAGSNDEDGVARYIERHILS